MGAAAEEEEAEANLLGDWRARVKGPLWRGGRDDWWRRCFSLAARFEGGEKGEALPLLEAAAFRFWAPDLRLGGSDMGSGAEVAAEEAAVSRAFSSMDLGRERHAGAGEVFDEMPRH